MTVRMSNKLPVRTQRTTVILIKVKSDNALLHIILVRICNFLKSVPRYKFVVMDTYNPDTLYVVRGQGCEDPIFEAKRGSPSRKVWKSLV